jgi:SAM-dependent methyltransferase
MLACGLTIFTGAFLLFLVQPLIGKYILPWYGGGPGVWTTCLLFFQVLLLGGYAYAHVLATRFTPRRQAAIQLGLVAVSLLLLPITPHDSWKPGAGDNPVVSILRLLLITLGLPYFVLSSTSPLLQHWFSLTKPGRSPYRLYALSNVASLLALLGYPFFFEVELTRQAQARLWGAGLVLYAVFSVVCVWQLLKRPLGPSPQPESAGPLEATATPPPAAPSIPTKLLWILLPATASVLLLATTNKLCQDMAAAPFLWVLPLAAYLLSFIVSFDSPRWYARFPFTLALIAAMAGISWALRHGSDLSVPRQIALYASGLFVCCMVCHGELYRLRPEARHLTAFYLMISLGGAVGGAFVAIAAPLLFKNYYELHWGLFVCAVLFFIACARDRASPNARGWKWLGCALPILAFAGLDWLLRHSPATNLPSTAVPWVRGTMWLLFAGLIASWVLRGQFRRFSHWRLLACLWLFFGAAALGLNLWMQTRNAAKEAVYRSRNFYGVLTVYEHQTYDPEGHHLLLQHGRITHGIQFVELDQHKWATTYYGEQSGIGLALQSLPSGFKRVGLVGLGAGTLATYGEAGDYFRFYEINADVIRLAQARFTFLRDSLAQTELVEGDARLSLETEPPQKFDLLALDAFSSDSIPVHLLTAEAFATYARHLKPDGVLAIHISNHFLDLAPVVAGLARQFNYGMATIDYDEEDDRWWLYASTWVLLSRNAAFLSAPGIASACNPENQAPQKTLLWTDDYASLYPILK